MLKRIENQIEDFTSTIKEPKGCEEMLRYLHSSIFATIKLLMFASPIFSLYIRVMLFFVIASAVLLLSSTIGAIAISSAFLLAMTLVLFFILLIYIVQCKKLLAQSIQTKKEQMSKE